MSSHSEVHEPHVMPLAVYLGVGGALLFLTAVTVGAAFIDFNALIGISSINLIVAMVIATVKASLVVLFFMHLFYDNKLYMVAFLTSLTCLAIFIIITLFDTVRRGDIYQLEGGPIKTQAAMYDKQVAPSDEPSESSKDEHH